MGKVTGARRIGAGQKGGDMCCLVAAALLIGPRAGIIVWWLLDSGRFGDAFDGWLLPLLGFLLLPWTTLAYLVVFPGGVGGLDWVWLVVGLLFDLSGYGGGARRRWRSA
jgi:hypothetical protein